MVRGAGDYCDLTVPTMALMAGCSEREAQYALKDLQHLDWLEKVEDVGAKGGMPVRGAQKRGNVYRVKRPAWAWNGQHRKRLWSLATASGVGVHALHPSLQELFGIKNPNASEPGEGLLERQGGRGAQHAPLTRVHRPHAPSLLRLKKEPKEEGRPQKVKPLLQWPSEAKGFVNQFKAKYGFWPECDGNALATWLEIKVGAGGIRQAEATMAAFLADLDPFLVKRKHHLNVLRKQWRQHAPLQPPPDRPRPKLHAAEGLLERLGR